MECLANLLFREVEDRIAAGALVARIDQSVERERIIFGGGDLFFDQGAKGTKLNRVEMHVNKGATRERRR
jgi:hypothetical protein